jgi:hypothetical protein
MAPNDPLTLVDRLRNPVTLYSGELDIAVALAVMSEAADKIEHLQRLLGGVSEGMSYDDIRKAAERQRTMDAARKAYEAAMRAQMEADAALVAKAELP